jgi:hypothetical protein
MAVAIGVVALTTYRSWRAGPWDIPAPMAPTPAAVVSETQISLAPRAPMGTEAIISKNLFDPERGAGASREAEENSRAVQRVRGMVLVGTVIIGNNRVAILQDGANPAPGQPVPGQRPVGQPPSMMRLKVGDSLEGFRLTEIADQRVVFARDATRVEVQLDFFRKVDSVPPRPVVAPGQNQTPAVGAPVPVPRVLPNLPRRGRIPVPESGNPES